MRGAAMVAVFAIGAATWLACSSSYDADDQTGERFNACYANGTCNSGLSCIDGLCVLPDTGGPNTLDGAASSSSSGGSSSGITSSSSTSSSGSVVTTGVLAMAKAYCAKIQRCLPSSFVALYGAVAACEAPIRTSLENAVALPGLRALTDAERMTCAQAFDEQDCRDVSLPAACVVKGTLVNASPCNVGEGQCATATCFDPAGSECGLCAGVGAKDSPCDQGCAPGLFCKTGKCVAILVAGEACVPGDQCAANLVCTGGKCRAYRVLDEDCSGAGSVCLPGLLCSTATKKCVDYTYASLGGPCDLVTGNLCAKSRCDANTKKCVAYAATNEDCDASKLCDPEKDICDFAGDKKCKAIPPPTVCK